MAAKNPAPSKTRPADGTCRHRNAEKLYDCTRPVGKDGWTWGREHVTAHAQERRAAAPSKAAQAPAAPKAKAAKADPKAKANAPAKVVAIPVYRQRPHAPRREPVARVAAMVAPAVEVTRAD